MKVKRLHLQNYGRFEDLKIDFAPTTEKTGNVTVIVGNNGAGKSQILQALATSLSWFVGSLKTGEITGSKIDLKLIKNDKTEASIKVITDHQKDNKSDVSKSQFSFVQWQLSNVRDGRVEQLGNNFSQLNGLVKRYRNKLTHVENFALPLLVLYPVERAVLQYVAADTVSYGYDQLKGYYGSLDGASIDFSDFLSWFRNAEDIENEANIKNIGLDKYSYNEKKKEIDNEISKLETMIEKEDNENNKIELLKTLLKRYSESIKMADLYMSEIDLSRNLLIRSIPLLATKEAIEDFTCFQNPHIRRQDTPTMIVEKDGEELDVNQLSQGEKSLLALVGDIARRLATLNPSLDNPLEGEGVVMIDEVDLHLHPKWQHDLIDKLVKTFPNVQFILTTHSPHVISDRNDILLYSLDDNELTEMPNVYGEDANTVLTKIFDVDIRDSDVEEQFTIIRRAISKHDYVTAENCITELAEKLPSDHLELLKCRLLLAQARLANSNTHEPSHAKD
ncbi:MAG TPA: ATP-binding protein [Psychrobacter sp.]|mgnify:CR=1 FL=1|nr:ATP-binding protein [Psychrobacter sp.]|tara:strand:+ start:133 stop:1647 length:1515 start_codon:yes stop_codon:yes gene_type:complete